MSDRPSGLSRRAASQMLRAWPFAALAAADEKKHASTRAGCLASTEPGLSADERARLEKSIAEGEKALAVIRDFNLPPDVAPSLRFQAMNRRDAEVLGEDVLYLSATELGSRLRSRQLSPVELAEAYLARIDRLAPTLKAFVTVTRDRALAQPARPKRRSRPGSSAARSTASPTRPRTSWPSRACARRGGRRRSPPRRSTTTRRRCAGSRRRARCCSAPWP